MSDELMPLYVVFSSRAQEYLPACHPSTTVAALLHAAAQQCEMRVWSWHLVGADSSLVDSQLTLAQLGVQPWQVLRAARDDGVQLAVTMPDGATKVKCFVVNEEQVAEAIQQALNQVQEFAAELLDPANYVAYTDDTQLSAGTSIGSLVRSGCLELKLHDERTGPCPVAAAAAPALALAADAAAASAAPGTWKLGMPHECFTFA